MNLFELRGGCLCVVCGYILFRRGVSLKVFVSTLYIMTVNSHGMFFVDAKVYKLFHFNYKCVILRL